MTIFYVMEIYEIKPNVNPARLKRPKKHSAASLYRDHPHSTIGGRGIVGRLICNNKHR